MIKKRKNKGIVSRIMVLLLMLTLILPGVVPVVAAEISETPQVEVSFDPQGGTGVMEPVFCSPMTDITPPENSFMAPEGKVFKAWKFEEQEYAPGAEITIGDDTVVKAVWEDGLEEPGETKENPEKTLVDETADNNEDLNNGENISEGPTEEPGETKENPEKTLVDETADNNEDLNNGENISEGPTEEPGETKENPEKTLVDETADNNEELNNGENTSEGPTEEPSSTSEAETSEKDQVSLREAALPPMIVKKWDDGDNQDGIRPEFVHINIVDLEGTLIDTLTLTPYNDWMDYTPHSPYNIKVEEATVNGYTSTVTWHWFEDWFSEGYIVTNSHTPEKTVVAGSKTWNDNDNAEGKRPNNITIRLLKNGTEIASKEVTEADGWAWRFEDLPKYEAGELINYTITEDAVEGYSSEISGYNVTNSYTPGKTSVQVTKAWKDNNNQDGKRPDAITIKLLADGEDTGRTLTLSKSNNWMGSFSNLDENKEGRKIDYTVDEESVNGYTSTVTGDPKNGFTVINSYTPEKTVVEGSKTWDDDNNQAGERPEEIHISLLKNGTEIDSRFVTAADGWAWRFEDLPKYEAGELINYTIHEEPMYNYISEVSGYDVTNTYTPGKTSVQVTKAWLDGNNRDGKRPESVTVKLLADGEDTGQTLTLSKSNNWTGFFQLDLDNEESYDYTVQEEAVGNGYTSTVAGDLWTGGFTVVNIYTPEKTVVAGSKTWNDNDNAEGKRPESITIRLFKNGTELESRVVTEADGWAWRFTDLPKYEAGELIPYTITEDAVEGYSSEVSGYDVTNSYTGDKTGVRVTKTWEDGNNQDGLRPESVTVKLLADGEDTGKTLMLTATNDWTGTFTDLDEYKAGQKIVYTIEEVAVGNGYTSAVTGNAETGFTVTNSYTPPTEPTEPTTPTEPTKPTTPTEPTKPTTPTEPTKPTTPTEPTKPTGPTVLPRTGEDSGPYLWLSLMCMSVGALLLLFRRKTKIQND